MLQGRALRFVRQPRRHRWDQPQERKTRGARRSSEDGTRLWGSLPTGERISLFRSGSESPRKRTKIRCPSAVRSAYTLPQAAPLLAWGQMLRVSGRFSSGLGICRNGGAVLLASAGFRLRQITDSPLPHTSCDGSETRRKVRPGALGEPPPAHQVSGKSGAPAVAGVLVQGERTSREQSGTGRVCRDGSGRVEGGR